jgi:hypothetical protein
MLRLVCAVLLVWVVVAASAWTMVSPGESLVSPRRSLPSAGAWAFEPPAVDAALATLEKSTLWGVQRSGQSLAPPAAAKDEKAEPTRWAQWWLVATAVRPQERYIVIQTNGAEPLTIREGEKLPDGARLLKVDLRAITLQSAEGKKRVIQTHIE